MVDIVSAESTNSGPQEIEGIRIEIEERKTYWIDKRPDGWTNQEWAETVAAAERGERDHEGIEALLPMKAHIIEEDFEVDRVVWERA